MKLLSLFQAGRCERAKPGTPCRCRCNGALHGAARGLDEAFFAALPETDPHKARDRPPGKVRTRRVKPLPLLDRLEAL